ncbi:MAG TPA: DNA repair protein RadA [Nitrospinota bacterium]|nr:DNA repair protein RadA [Nitrospinota bacterium]
MSKEKTYFLCQACGYKSQKWLGRCPGCDEWNTLVEEKELVTTSLRKSYRFLESDKKGPTPITDIDKSFNKRLSSEILEFDRVLGGGVVPGSVVLVGGDPGIGKSTLLLQAMGRIAKKGGRILYVSGEESFSQIRLRGERLNTLSENLFILSETSFEEIIKEVKRFKPLFLVIDSIQTIYTEELQSAPGSISQVRDVSSKLMFLSKAIGISTLIIGHVTKDGAIAGPKVLEHIVDTVLYFEGERNYPYRILRAVKNRFGSTNEIGVFSMEREGLKEISNPSEAFLLKRSENVPGSVIVPSMEGSRPIMVEIQTLVSPSILQIPRRMTIGLDYNRVSLLIAILEKRIGFRIHNQDIFVNLAGGVKIYEPAIDLGIIIAIASSFKNKPVDSDTIVVGEVGLGGEVRNVSHIERRINESERLGFKRCLIPQKGALKEKKGSAEIIPVENVHQAIEILL